MLGLITIPKLSLFAADPLWIKALDFTAPANTEKAAMMEMQSRELNRNGELIKTINMIFTLDRSSGDYILVSADEEGKDVTDKLRRQSEKRKSGNPQDYVHQIFNPGNAENLALSARAATAIVNGRECRIYDFHLEDERPMGPGKPKYVVEEGMVFIDIESGMPLRLTSSMVEGPDSLKRFDFSMSGGPGSGGLWRVKEIKTAFIARMIIYKAGEFRMRFIYEG